jgi:hypothetical protein
MRLAGYGLAELFGVGKENLMAQIYCGYKDCENYEDGICISAAVRIEPGQGCLTYRSVESIPDEEPLEQGDRLTWDEEYFEYEFLDDEIY